MNTPLDNDDHELRHAEYVLGVLDAAARVEVEGEIESDPQAATAVQWWQQHLTPLSEDIAATAPPEYIWARIQDALGHAATIPASDARAPAKRGLWDSLVLWRWLGVGASVVAAACLVLVFTVPRITTVPPAVVSPAYMVASIAQNNGVAGWTATMDLDHKRMVVVPATPAAVAADKSTELWLIPPGQKPISLGLIAENRPTTVTLSPTMVKQLSAKALLAVSVEPHGGSPTGQPTGPVVAKGAISGA